MVYEKPKFKVKYENYIGGEFVAPVGGEYFDNVSPVDGQILPKLHAPMRVTSSWP